MRLTKCGKELSIKNILIIQTKYKKTALMDGLFNFTLLFEYV